MDKVIEINGFSKNYDGVLAVKDLNFRVDKGEIFGFLGPNGAGKTTTIKSMIGLLKPTSGSIKINGMDVTKKRREVTIGVGYLPENMELYSNLTGRETLEFFADIRDVSFNEINPLLRKVGLMDAAERKVGEYSKGMVQRLALAQSLLGSPPLLILDEPTSGLDPEGTSLVKNIVMDYTKDGKTVFFSSHILPNVQEVADRVAIITKGELRAIDSVENLRERLEIPSKLQLEISTDISEIRDYLESSDKVKKYYGQKNRVLINCKAEDKMEIMREIEKLGVQINSFTTEEGSLEDIFLSYTGGENLGQ